MSDSEPSKGVLWSRAALNKTTCFLAREAGDLCELWRGDELFASGCLSGLGVRQELMYPPPIHHVQIAGLLWHISFSTNKETLDWRQEPRSLGMLLAL